ncbi:MAG: M24 family metallopeptidase [Pelagibacteraceae bacterium]
MKKIKEIKKLILQHNLDGYLVPKNDEFFGEYVSEEKDNLKYISNFTGSFGLAIILKKKNYLFVDGRYTLQAKIQSSKNFKIITFPQELPKNIFKKKILNIGFDPKIHTQKMLDYFFFNSKCNLVPVNFNLIDKIKNKKKIIKPKPFFILKNKDSGSNYQNKIIKLAKILKRKKVDIQFISAPENIAWLLNLRGNDSKFSPLPNAYFFIDKEKNCFLFCDLRKINKNIKITLKNIRFIDINFTYIFFLKIKNKKIIVDKNTCSIFFKNILKKNNQIIEEPDIINNLKSIKNKIEIKNTIKSHIYDGAALTKFLFWLKNNFKRKKISEISAQNKLFSFRKKIKTFRSLSFPTISGSGPNGAIIHYKATKKSNRNLQKGDLYLIDSGAQYNFGTTDVTRTISLENKNSYIKDIFTRVLKGHIAVANYKLNKRTYGSQIDFVARKALKKINLDYPHGTGHGVGYFLNVHEGPHGISRGNKIKLQEGMIVSNEPGYYKKGEFGIRIENLVTVIKKKNKYKFKDLTLAPIEKSLIKKELLNKKEIDWLNNYHNRVYLNLKKYMNTMELKQLKDSCSNI